jgi:predicted alpha/beta-hydrolase family hydrolase
MSAVAKTLRLDLPDKPRISALLYAPRKARACYVLAHGAGAGMNHPFMAALAGGLAERGIATFRFNFLYMERGSRCPDIPPVAHAAIRAAVAAARRRFPRLPLFAGGKSFGGRMASQAQALAPLPGVYGLIVAGFPLHPPKKPSTERADHLFTTDVPLLFLQGTRDELASLPLIKRVARKIGSRVTLHLIPEVDHYFHVPARSGRKDHEVLAELIETILTWIERAHRPRP